MAIPTHTYILCVMSLYGIIVCACTSNMQHFLELPEEDKVVKSSLIVLGEFSKTKNNTQTLLDEKVYFTAVYYHVYCSYRTHVQ